MKKYRAICVVGRRKSGKTTIVKEKILKKHKGKKFIYDVNGEYGEFGGVIMDMDKFHDIAVNLSNSLILYEEATIFFSNKGDIKSVRNMLVRARHTNNIVVFCFHNLQGVPLNILNMCDLLILKKTNDNYQLVEKKFKGMNKLIAAVKLQRVIPDPFHAIWIDLGD